MLAQREAQAGARFKAVRSSSVHGSPESIIDKAVDHSAGIYGEWAYKIADAIPVTDSPSRIFWAINDAIGVDDFEGLVEVNHRAFSHGMMLGALDAQYEYETSDTVKPEEFALKYLLAEPTSDFAGLPYDKAIKQFLEKKPMTRAAFDALDEKSKRKAFTVAGASRTSIVRTVQRELARQVARGADLKDFRNNVVPRLKAAGWTPKNSSHVENVYRTNVAKTYAAGRVEQMMKPMVLKHRPIWTWIGVQDGPPRQRESHNKAGRARYSMHARNPEWARIYPPAGFMCRCRCISTSEAKATNIVASILALLPDLVDEGFTAGVSSLMDATFPEPKPLTPKTISIPQPSLPVAVEPPPAVLPPEPTPVYQGVPLPEYTPAQKQAFEDFVSESEQQAQAPPLVDEPREWSSLSPSEQLAVAQAFVNGHEIQGVVPGYPFPGIPIDALDKFPLGVKLQRADGRIVASVAPPWSSLPIGKRLELSQAWVDASITDEHFWKAYGYPFVGMPSGFPMQELNLPVGTNLEIVNGKIVPKESALKKWDAMSDAEKLEFAQAYVNGSTGFNKPEGFPQPYFDSFKKGTELELNNWGEITVKLPKKQWSEFSLEEQLAIVRKYAEGYAIEDLVDGVQIVGFPAHEYVGTVLSGAEFEIKNGKVVVKKVADVEDEWSFLSPVDKDGWYEKLIAGEIATDEVPKGMPIDHAALIAWLKKKGKPIPGWLKPYDFAPSIPSVAPVAPTIAAPLAPPPPPPPLPNAKAVAENILGTQVGPQGGSNPGGVYEGLDGVKRYVKFYSRKESANAAQAQVEHLTNQIYGDLGLGALKSEVFEDPANGKLAYASEIIDGAKQLGGGGKISKADARKAFDGFAADVLTMNWDAAGMSVDNLVKTPKGKIVRIDNGGALHIRAQGANKPEHLLDTVTEWDGFFKSGTNPGYAALANAAGYVGPHNFEKKLVKGIKKILQVEKKNKGWSAYINKNAVGLDQAEKDKIARMLTARTRFLEKKLTEIEARVAAYGDAPPRIIEQLESARLPAGKSQAVKHREQWEFDRAAEQRILNNMSNDSKRAITRFTGTDYTAVREAAHFPYDEWKAEMVRRGRSYELELANYEAARAEALRIEAGFEALQSTVEASVEREVTEVYRGIKRLPRDTVEKIINAREVTIRGPTSTSWDPHVPKESFSVASEDSVFFVFKLKPEGAKNRIAIKKISEVPGENEVLLRRGTRFKVNDVKREVGGGRVIMHLEEIIEEVVGTGNIDLRS